MSLPDTQSNPDQRQLAIDAVGIKAVQLPLTVQMNGAPQATVATLAFSVALPAHQKGTHMSRFLQLWREHFGAQQALDYDSALQFFAAMLERLEAQAGEVTLNFTLFVEKFAPVSQQPSIMAYPAQLKLWRALNDSQPQIAYTVQVAATSLCPCSKEISAYGAHNQRSHLTISTQADRALNWLHLIRAAEESASSELFGVLKRADEKFVTEYAYDHPQFVEDLVRDMALKVRTIAGVTQFSVEAENFEAIHNHSAYAKITGTV